MIAELSDCGLLEVADLSAIPREPDTGKIDLSSPNVVRLWKVMEKYGVEGKEAKRIVAAFADAANAVAERYDGKIQKYFRHYGELMLSELNQRFSFTDLTSKEAADAFTEWLQNCLNMPLSLKDADLRAFCTQRGVSIDALIAAADEDNVNLAYLDDMAQVVAREAVNEAAEETDTLLSK